MYDNVLNVGGTEWVVIIFLALILILGTGKLPGAARKIGKAVNEYNKAKSGIEEHVKGIQEISDGIPKITGPVGSEREKLEMMGRTLGINPKDKSDEELQSAVSKKMGVVDKTKKTTTATTTTTTTDNKTTADSKNQKHTNI